MNREFDPQPGRPRFRWTRDGGEIAAEHSGKPYSVQVAISSPSLALDLSSKLPSIPLSNTISLVKRSKCPKDPVGSKFGKREGETWAFATSKDGDLRVPKATEAMFEKHKPTHVIHLAALVGGLFKNMKFKHGLLFVRFDLARENSVNRDRRGHRRPLPNRPLHSGVPLVVFRWAEGIYGDITAHASKEEFGMNFTSANPTNVFGPSDNLDLEDSHIIPGLIHKTYTVKREIEAGNKDAKLTVAGTGKPLRQSSILVILPSFGEDKEVSIEEVAKAITKAFGIERQYKLLSLIGSDFKVTPFDEALQESVNWFPQNYETARTGKK
ncbi:hypothetical protein FRC01_000777 [Tulasnella sp. 417]|nr:hypothetical protein FRC01_000777 [Tulasnella sp. 417]